VDNSVGKLAILVDKYLLPSKLSVEKIFWLWRKLFLNISICEYSFCLIIEQLVGPSRQKLLS